ncbi:S-adenosylmethionine:tRNA ribosyltransferase-isomerase [Flavihumibacter sp.]|uniref:S-adenosylmethionine:tRNA ribosyltransferase-isomerase n=1 Tax=Flavihumibacter sp. TaxID=1913981 RepID=UPI002FC5AAF2|nr:S-adenosylmethionine:tRNA ribosyltransferase-isomerase [Flavihumibacter sediminis]
MKNIKNPYTLQIADFSYELRDDLIAKFPLEERDASRLLIYRQGEITESVYRDLADEIPAGSLLVFNDTRVVRARLVFKKNSGSDIEVFCLEPDQRYSDISSAMATSGEVYWNCLVGGASKWKQGMTLEKKLEHDGIPVHLSASIYSRNDNSFTIHFSWNPVEITFAEILNIAGKMPIPPYLHRKSEDSDTTRYQTIYANQEGSVAAPTAGLHFTDHVFESLREKGITSTFVTLHVGAGTFKPVKSEIIGDHEMHAEFIDVQRQILEELVRYDGNIIAAGTTSMRTLESLYWMGVKVAVCPEATLEDISVKQWDPYIQKLENDILPAEAIHHLLRWMDSNDLTRIVCKTQIIIAPGYKVKMVRALITNFHQPQSTLLLLVAALIGEDWRKVYNYALENGYRFLSYGDGSLLWGN